MDNVFVIALIFAYFRVPREHQHRVLYWGILGALVMRGLMIGVGVALISLVDWVLYLFGAFLLYSGVKMLFVETEVHPEKNRVVRWARKVYPVAPAPRRAEVRHHLGGPQGAHAAGAGAADGGNHRPALRPGFHPGGLRRHAEALHRVHLERLCHPRLAFALFPAGRRHRLFPLPQIRPARSCWCSWASKCCSTRTNASRRSGFRSIFPPRSRCSWSPASS